MRLACRTPPLIAAATPVEGVCHGNYHPWCYLKSFATSITEAFQRYVLQYPMILMHE